MASIIVQGNTYSHEDFPIGSVVAFTQSMSPIRFGIVVKHAKIQMLIIYGYYSYNYSATILKEVFHKVSRDPDECVSCHEDAVVNYNEIETLINNWNRINKTNIEIKFR